jgi:hypothetical protein
MPKQTDSLIASWERAWSDAGLGSFATHVQTDEPATVIALVGEQLCFPVRDRSDLIRLDPSVDLETFAALLQASGWAVEHNSESSVAHAWRR